MHPSGPDEQSSCIVITPCDRISSSAERTSSRPTPPPHRSGAVAMRPRSTVPAPSGRTYAQASSVVARIPPHGLIRGTLRLGGVLPVGRVHPLIANFSRAHPGLAITLREDAAFTLIGQLRDAVWTADGASRRRPPRRARGRAAGR